MSFKDISAIRKAIASESTIRGRVAGVIDGITFRLGQLGDASPAELAKLKTALEAERSGLVAAIVKGTKEEGEPVPTPLPQPA